jgi:hypothetical protein
MHVRERIHHTTDPLPGQALVRWVGLVAPVWVAAGAGAGAFLCALLLDAPRPETRARTSPQRLLLEWLCAYRAAYRSQRLLMWSIWFAVALAVHQLVRFPPALACLRPLTPSRCSRTGRLCF